ncbi:MAG: glycosyltransferase family 2 protein [Clostridia bacterium]|nr:glycosyltransferase family 2 protein [Clostridia bacterium]
MDGAQILVSVVLPVYNVEPYLQQCLDSLTAQTLREIEIICVDDGSTDGSLALLERCAREDARITVLRQENAGAGAARNLGMSAARGRYLAILDSDDFYEPQMLARAYDEAERCRADVVVFASDYYMNSSGTSRPCYAAIDRGLMPAHTPFAAADVERDLFKLFIGWSWDKLFRADFVRGHGLAFQCQRTSNDLLFVFSAIASAERIAVLPDILAHHRMMEGTLSATREKSWSCYHDALMALRVYLQEQGLYARFERDYINYCVHFALWNLNTLMEPAYTQLYSQLRESWFAEYGALGKPKEYFYNQHEYRRFRHVCRRPAGRLASAARTMLRRLEQDGLLGRGLRCIRENGLMFTLRRAAQRLRGRLSR